MTDDRRLYDLQASLGYRITLLARINARQFEKHLSPLGLTRVNWCVLLAVEQQGLVNPSEIAAYVGIDRTATSRALRRLEADGLVHRSGGTGDKRTTEVRATDRGASILLRACDAARANAARFAGKLSRYERDALADLLGRLLVGESRDVKDL